MHKLKIIDKKDGYCGIFLDNKEIRGIISLELKMSAAGYDKIILELDISEIDINIPIGEIKIKSEKNKRYQLLDFT